MGINAWGEIALISNGVVDVRITLFFFLISTYGRKFIEVLHFVPIKQCASIHIKKVPLGAKSYQFESDLKWWFTSLR